MSKLYIKPMESIIKNNWRTLLLIAGILTAWLVYPTPYVYWTVDYGSGADAYRMHRLTRRIDSWYSSLGGWAPWTTESWVSGTKMKQEKEKAAGLSESK